MKNLKKTNVNGKNSNTIILHVFTTINRINTKYCKLWVVPIFCKEMKKTRIILVYQKIEKIDRLKQFNIFLQIIFLCIYFFFYIYKLYV